MHVCTIKCRHRFLNQGQFTWEIEDYSVSDKLSNSIRHIIAQFGGGTPTWNTTAPGGLGFGSGQGLPGSQSTYYEYPLDSNIKRLNDPSLSDPSLSIEKRLEIYHTDIENDLRNTMTMDMELAELKQSDVRLRKEKIYTDAGNPEPPKEPESVNYVSFETLLDAARTNSDEKHPYEDYLQRQHRT